LAHSWRRLTTGSVSRQILGAAISVALLTALVKAVTIGRELIVAWRFGTSDALDAYLIALLVPSFVVQTVAGSFNAAFIPTFIQVREREGDAAAQKLFSNVMLWSVMLLTATSILMLLCAPLYLPLIASGFSRAKLDLTFRLLLIVSPVVILSGLVTVWGAVLNAGRRFALAALSPVVTPATGVLFLIVFKSWSVFALAAGMLCGAFVEMIILGFALRRQSMRLTPTWHGFDAHMRQVAAQYGPMIAGAVLMTGTYLVDQLMAAMLPGGSVSALNYGSRVVALPLGLAATALGTVAVPYFSSMVARSDWPEVRHTLGRYLRLIFAVTVPLTLILILASRPLVRLLFERGAFTAEDSQVVARVQSFYALQIPFYIAGIMVVRVISSMQANQILLWGAAINLSVNIILNYLLMQWLGVAGIALSTSFVYLVSFIFCYTILNRRISKIERS
jgi:putative peptidoglycan lipid II flippase